MLDIHYNITQGIQNEVSSLAISVSIKIKLLFIQQDQLPSGTTHSSAPVYCHILCVPLLSNQLESEHTDLKDLTCPSRILSTGLFLRGNSLLCVTGQHDSYSSILGHTYYSEWDISLWRTWGEESPAAECSSLFLVRFYTHTSKHSFQPQRRSPNICRNIWKAIVTRGIVQVCIYITCHYGWTCALEKKRTLNTG